jgi:hypothetical protein
MKYDNFTEFLQDQHAEEYHGLDDEMPDAFDSWLVELDVDTMIEYADKYAQYRIGKIQDYVVKEYFNQ